ncbi:unnamed protein product [Cuscuta campestris]|uniref:PH domain-containing protein n=1 Tax=Cuscuta campestris TaxID=132261 RepID=A0A484KM42_9ASTE|nr:unnamed protein product [Cuscuta campestris]
MLEDQVAYLLQRYLGNYVSGLNKEALKISVWQGDVELTNMQLKPEALNALKLPVKVKAGFLGSVKLKVPWSRLGQDPVVVHLDRIFLLAEPATQVEGSSADAIQEVRKNRIREMETTLVESRLMMETEMNTSWLQSLISTIIGNLKLTISNIHIRYEDVESNHGHPFAAGITLEKLSAMTVDDTGKETFITGGALERIQKSVELEKLAVYFDSDIIPWHTDKPWEGLLPVEWVKVFKNGTQDGKPADDLLKEHSYILQPVSGNAKFSKQRPDASSFHSSEPLQRAAVTLDDVTLCLSKNGYRDMIKLAENFSGFNQRLKYAHFRPPVDIKSDPRSWWQYAFKAVSDQIKKASGKLSWEQVLRYTRLRKKYISLYASLLKSDPDRVVIDDNLDVEALDRELDIEIILQWRLLAHKFVKNSMESDLYVRKQKANKPWWQFGWSSQSVEDERAPGTFSEEDWERLNNIIGYKEGDEEPLFATHDRRDIPHTTLEIHMKHNASKLSDGQDCFADLSYDNLDCFIQLYSETKVFDIKLGSYQLLSPNGLIAESATAKESLVGVFCLKPLDANLDWSLEAKASPCYVTYLKDSVDQIVNFFESNVAVSQSIALETAAAVQMTMDEVKRTAQQQVNRMLKDQTRFLLDLNIAAPKVTIPTEFSPDGIHFTKLLLDLGNLVIRTKDDSEYVSHEDKNMYAQFDLVLSDVSAFLVDGDYLWGQVIPNRIGGPSTSNIISSMPVIDKCGVILKLQQIRLQNPGFPSTRISVRLPFLGFHFSPARYHRLMQVAKIFERREINVLDVYNPWSQADFEGWLSLLSRKGVGGREAVWQQRYVCIVGPFLYVLEHPNARSYKQYTSLRGKQLYQVPPEIIGSVKNVLAIYDAGQANNKIVEDGNALILHYDSEESKRIWQSSLQGAIYRASGSAPIAGISESSSDSEDAEMDRIDNHDTNDQSKVENLFLTGVLDELKICFNYCGNHDHNFTKVMLEEEKRLFEFRARGGMVEISIRGKDIFIGTVLKALEIKDLIFSSGISQPYYLARSFISSSESSNSPQVDIDAQGQHYNIISSSQYDAEDKFYEASEDLNDIDSPHPLRDGIGFSGSTTPFSSEKTITKAPSFNRMAGLLPMETTENASNIMEVTDTFDSFVKAQVIIFDRDSPIYSNVDTKVVVTLATLSFFCRRPTILAIMHFVNAININEESRESFNDTSSSSRQHDNSNTKVDGVPSGAVDEPLVKNLLGKGKSRVIFCLKLNMARAQILLMKEDGSSLATLSQDNFLTDIKVFPSSFSIKASLGNLQISDDNLPSSHSYYWACDMRNPGGRSFVELEFCSFNVDDEDYEGHDYSLLGELCEVRVVYLNRFIQEVISYFMGLVPNNTKDFVRIKDQVTNSEKWFTRNEVEGSPALKLDVSLRKPIILMPRCTDSLDLLQLDVVQITIKNTFQWFCGSKNEMNAVHTETLTVSVQDINLNIGAGSEVGESIIQDVNGISIVIQRSLRDLLHQIPSVEVDIKIEELKAALSSTEYQIITECALANFSETPNTLPPIVEDFVSPSAEIMEPLALQSSEIANGETEDDARWVNTKVSVSIELVELCLFYGLTRDASLATLQVSGLWLLYKTNTAGEGFLSATLGDFSVVDDRDGIQEELKMAIRKPDTVGYKPSNYLRDGDNNHVVTTNDMEDMAPSPTMVILDGKFAECLTSVSLCIQRPQLLVTLDFLLAVTEFFVPTVRSMLSNDRDMSSSHLKNALILDQPTYTQPCSELSLSPLNPLVADDERYDLFVYDGRGGILYLQDRLGKYLSSPSPEALIYVGSGKKLQFTNVTIKNGRYLDSSILLGPNSSYSVLEDDKVFLEEVDDVFSAETHVSESVSGITSHSPQASKSTEFIFEMQAIAPELTFYNTSKDVGESLELLNKLLHAQLDAFCRIVIKGDTTEIDANFLGLTMESNGIRIVEPFDTSMKYSNASGKTNMHFSVSDIFMNFSFSILRLFLAVEEDVLAFMRTTSKKVTIVCSEFDKIGSIKCGEQVYVFWRPRAPPGYAILGDYLTPIDKPPTKGVIALNSRFVRVKRPESFTLVCSSSQSQVDSELCLSGNYSEEGGVCSIWFPRAPKGYVAMGCVASPGNIQPLPTSVFCISECLVSPCDLRDCINVGHNNRSTSLAFWRVDNSVGTFLPADPATLSLSGRAYGLRHVVFGLQKDSSKLSKGSEIGAPSKHRNAPQPEQMNTVSSGRRFEAVATFKLIWWNQGSGSRKRLSIWRPIVPEGMIYFGDIAVKGYEPPNMCIVLHDSEELFKAPFDFQHTGQIKKHRATDNISFWMPQPPSGFVSLGCIACKGTPKASDFFSLRCIRSDMVTGTQFLDESVWDTSEIKFIKHPLSVWVSGNNLGTFVVRSDYKKPPKRFALKLADHDVPSDSDVMLIDADIRTFSVALFDDYGGLMVPLCNVSLSEICFSFHGRSDNFNANVTFSLAGRSYNDKYDSWEPLIEQLDTLLRYRYDVNAPGAASQLRLTSTRDLNLNVSVSNVNTIFQAYASWDNLGHIKKTYEETVFTTDGGKPIIDIHHKKNYFIIPQNKLGQDIFMRTTGIAFPTKVIKMPSGDSKPVRVPVTKNMLDSHMKGSHFKKCRKMLTVILSEAELKEVAGLSSHLFSVAVRVFNSHDLPVLPQQSARTRGISTSVSSAILSLEWNEVFFFKIDSLDFYNLELIVTDIGKGDVVGSSCVALKHIYGSHDTSDGLHWIELFSNSPVIHSGEGSVMKSAGRLKCAFYLSPQIDLEISKGSSDKEKNVGFIQISPTREGPWTTVRLNYAAPAACWRLGNNVVASEVSIVEGNRYVNIRSLVSVRNDTEFTMHLRLKHRISDETMLPDNKKKDENESNIKYVTCELFETQIYDPTAGWVGPDFKEMASGVGLPSGWEWVDAWHVDESAVNTADGWVYAPDVESLKWPESCNPVKFVNYARQRRWFRDRTCVSGDPKPHICVGPLRPGEVIPLPLSALAQSGRYVLQLRPDLEEECSWSSVIDGSHNSHDFSMQPENSGICVSTLKVSEELLCCSLISEISSNSCSRWFCLSIQATEIARDINSDPIQDWTLVIQAPLSISNYLPFVADYSVHETQKSGHFLTCSEGVLGPGKCVKVYNADIRNPVYLSLLPQRGWLPVHEAVLISHPSKVPSKMISLRSSITGRIVQIILEQGHVDERPLQAKSIKVSSPYWLAIRRCPPLTLRFLDLEVKKSRKVSFPFHSKSNSNGILEEITDEEIYDGYTIASALNFKKLGIMASIGHSGKEHFGCVSSLSPLSEMDGSLDLHAYDADGKCMQIYVSSKPCPYQSVSTKVISFRPFITFTNRVGQSLFIKLSSQDEPKILHASDARVPFVVNETSSSDELQTSVSNILQVRLVDTNWSFPIQIVKEDTFSLVLRTADGTRKFVRIEIRGFEEGSRFIVVFRLGSTNGPIRIENRTSRAEIRVRQSGFGDDMWIQLLPLSTTNFSWEDPYGLKAIDSEIRIGNSSTVLKLDLDRSGFCSKCDEYGLLFHVADLDDIRVARFVDEKMYMLVPNEGSLSLTESKNLGSSSEIQNQTQELGSPLELTIELGAIGVSVVNHNPKELSYIYLEKVSISYSTGYDGGSTSRFKLIVGYLQFDNQLPLTSMPVLLVPEQTFDLQHPVFKMTVTMRNENVDGIQVYPYIYIRVTDKCWRLNIHEPIIWAFVEFYNNLQLDRLPKSSNIGQVDPEIRVDLIDISEVRLKLSLEPSPAQRPHGVLGVWSPILSAIGNAFKIQVHLRPVVRRDRFMRKSAIVSSIGNRFWRDLIHNPLHLIFSVDVLGMASSTLASLSKGFAELSTDGQFLHLRSKQVRSRRITGVGEGFLQGTEALAQGVAFGVSGVVTKPVESARQNGLLGLAHGLGRAFVGFIAQPMSGALDFFSLTVDGIGASCTRCIEILSNKTSNFHRIRYPRAIHSDNLLRDYCEREALGQMMLYLAEERRGFGCTELFKEPSKFAWSDYYEDHFTVPYQRIVLVTNKRVMLLQCVSPDKMDKKPCKIMWDVPWEEVLSLELAKAGYPKPSHLIIHLKHFQRPEKFVRVVKCNTNEEGLEEEPQAVKICLVVRKWWKAHHFDMHNLGLKVLSSQRRVCFAWDDSEGTSNGTTGGPSSSSSINENKFILRVINFSKVWSSEPEVKGRCTLCQKRDTEEAGLCTIWRPICPRGYVSIGDITRTGPHPPNVASVYRYTDKDFILPMGFDLVWRNCSDDYTADVSIWHPRAPDGYVSPGCVAVPGFAEPEPDAVYCIAESLVEETVFEEQKIWSAPDSYPWACHVYQVHSDALHFVALRQPREESNWKPMRVIDDDLQQQQPSIEIRPSR